MTSSPALWFSFTVLLQFSSICCLLITLNYDRMLFTFPVVVAVSNCLILSSLVCQAYEKWSVLEVKRLNWRICLQETKGTCLALDSIDQIES